MVARGGGPVATFFVADDDKQALVGEWVGVHELAHLLTPYIQRQDAWMSEGVATWYQNIARMRSGLLSKEECWAKMVDGFARGRRAASSASTVQQASARMHETFAYTYVYWAGTAAALLLDVQARVQSNGAWSLDRASDAVLDDAVAAQKRLTAKRYAELLDQAAGTDMFVDEVVRVERTQGFPDVQQVLWKLGVHEKHDGTVWLDDKAEWAWVRHAIERPVAAPATPKQKTASTTSR